MDTRLVSVIIPAYNCEAYIGQAIRSVLAQTEQDFEIVVVDDASADRTVDVVSGFSDERLRLYVNEQNRGASHTRNRAIGMARGTWLALLDADDWYAPERLERLVEIAQRRPADMVADNLHLVATGDAADEQNGSSRNQGVIVRVMRQLFSEKMKRALPRQLTVAEFIRGNMPGSVSNLAQVKTLVRREFLLRNGIAYDEHIRSGEDLAFYFACLVHGARFTLLPEAYYFSREDRAGSIRHTSKRDQLGALAHKYEVNSRLLEQYHGECSPEIKQALILRHRRIERFMAYQRFKRSLRTRSMAGICKELAHHPYGLVAMLAFRGQRKLQGCLQRVSMQLTQAAKNPSRKA